MRHAFKKRFPDSFEILKKIYHKTFFYNIYVKLLNIISIRNNNIKYLINKEIMVRVFNGKYQVYNGPFKGMKYIERSSGSAFLPKIMGSYEEPLHAWINSILISNKYTKILDIGCAEGYYAVGFAMGIPSARVIAYDTSPIARKNIDELIKINNVTNIEIKETCTHSELDKQCSKKTLVFCDIEGYEEVLLDPINVPNLKNVDLLVELHDCFIPEITEEIISRFQKTHNIDIQVDYPYRVGVYETPNLASQDDFDQIVDENRPQHMKFVYLKAK